MSLVATVLAFVFACFTFDFLFVLPSKLWHAIVCFSLFTKCLAWPGLCRVGFTLLDLVSLKPFYALYSYISQSFSYVLPRPAAPLLLTPPIFLYFSFFLTPQYPLLCSHTPSLSSHFPLERLSPIPVKDNR